MEIIHGLFPLDQKANVITQRNDKKVPSNSDLKNID